MAITVHALLNKRDARKAVGWIALAWLAPLGGALAYLVFGVRRIRRAGVALGLTAAWPAEGGQADVAAQRDAPGLTGSTG